MLHLRNNFIYFPLRTWRKTFAPLRLNHRQPNFLKSRRQFD